MSHDTGLVGQQGSNELPDLRIGVLAFAATELPGGVFLDWRRGSIGDLAPCVTFGEPALCRSPAKDKPCPKGCAEDWIATHAANAADRVRLVRAHTLRGWSPVSFRVIIHEPVCPDCGSDHIGRAEVQTGDGVTETAHICRDCGTA